MNYYDEFRRDSTGNDTQNNIPENHRDDSSPKRSTFSKHTAVAIALACILSSSALGFGGGLLASNLNATEDTSVSNVATPASSASVVSSSSDSGSGAMTVSEIVNSASESVVEIRTQVTQVNSFMQTVSGEAAGSGVIISEDGYIVTNNHVIEDADSISVRLSNGDSYDATLVGTDPQTDLAVIKIEATGLKAATMGDSDALQVGDETVAIGNPLGELGGTVTNGIVSALDREITLGDETMNLLQTNAAINPGNSGGGLFNDQGELIGIVVAKSSGSGIEGLGFAIPINDAKPVISDLIEKGYVSGRGQLGVSMIDISDAQTAFLYRVPQTGTYVAAVNDGSAAQKAGLKVGDGIIAVGDQEVSSATEIKNALKDYNAGDTVTLTILRDSQQMKISVTLDESVPESVSAVEPQEA